MNAERLAVFFDVLFPFSFEFGPDLTLRWVGHGFDHRFPTVVVGASLSCIARIERPVLPWDFETLIAAQNKLVVLEILESPVRFTGQLVSIGEVERTTPELTGRHARGKVRDPCTSCYFVGGPWVSSLEVMDASRLKLADFPPHDPRGDLLLQAQAREAMLQDLAETNRRMKQAREEARILQEHAERRQRMDVAAQVSGGLAHNFNNLLALMNGHLELADARLKSGDLVGASQRLEEAQSATSDAADLIRQIQNLSVDRAVELQRVDLVEAVARAKRLVQPALGSDVSWSVPEGDPEWVYCDPRALQEVLINLAINAAEAMEGEGSITTSLSGDANAEASALGIPVRTAKLTCLTFSDSGPGLPEHMRDRVFEPFFSTKGEQHSGLGLATVERLIALSGGAVLALPSLGSGAVFKIFLEAAEE